MDYWTQLTTEPSLLIGPVLVAAVVSGGVSIFVGRANRKATSADVDRKIKAEHETTNKKIQAEHQTTQSKIEAERVVTERKIGSEAELLQAKLSHEASGRLVERAWADYSLRRDIYIDLVSRIDYLFGATDKNDDAELLRRKDFLRSAQKVRLIGSDEVVKALNLLTEAIKENALTETRTYRYRVLMNAIRKDIRTLNEMPAVGTELDGSAFPIET